jgi:hypothetical protein
MPVVVEFSEAHAGRNPSAKPTVLGPYLSVQLTGDTLYAQEGIMTVPLAVRDVNGDWTVVGLEGVSYPIVIVRPPPDQHAEDVKKAKDAYNADQ